MERKGPAGRSREAATGPLKTFFFEIRKVEYDGMIKGNNENENETRAPQPHDPKCDTITRKDSPEETIKRMRALPERIAKFEEVLRGLREANTR